MNSGSSFYFPTYVAHLLGGAARHPAIRPLACATLTNDAATSRSATLTASLPSYATAAVRTVSVPAGMTSTVCLTPSFLRPALTALTAPTAGSVEVSATGDFVTPPSSINLPVTVLPLNNFLTQNSAVPYAGTLEPVLGIWFNGMLELLPVFSMPTSPLVTNFLSTVAAQSAYGGFGDSPYTRPAIARGPVSTGTAGATLAEGIYLEAGESISIAPIAVTGGDASVSVALFDPAQYQLWIAGRGGTPTAFWARRMATSPLDTYTNRTTAGQTLALVFAAPDTTSRTVRWFRSNTRQDVANDALKAIYNALRARGTTYTNIAASYYLNAGGQRVRLPAETLASRTGNCIDGALLFASLLELIGMEPVITTVQRPGGGHAYVGVRSAPGSRTVWSVETTMLGTAIYEQAALAAAEEAGADAANSATRVYPIDIMVARRRGITPIPRRRTRRRQADRWGHTAQSRRLAGMSLRTWLAEPVQFAEKFVDGVELATQLRVPTHRHALAPETHLGAPRSAIAEVRREGLAEVLVTVAGRVSADVTDRARSQCGGVAGLLVGEVILTPSTTEAGEPGLDVEALPHGVSHLVEDVLTQRA